MASNLKNGNKYKAIDFFCGGGGVTCGWWQAVFLRRKVYGIIH